MHYRRERRELAKVLPAFQNFSQLSSNAAEFQDAPPIQAASWTQNEQTHSELDKENYKAIPEKEIL
eukprot:3013440-Amphidinium_carterae.1